jgi:hypothetical protein
MQYLAKPLVIQLQVCHAPKSVYLRWLSALGTWEGWLFEGDVDTKSSIEDASEIATADGRATVAVRRSGDTTLTIRSGDLSEEQHDALASSLLLSPQVYRQYANGQRVPVLVAASATATRTSSDGRYTFDLDIKLPSRNALTH